MSDDDMADLIDSRCKLTAESNQMLEAHARATGKDKSELIREIVHDWYEAEFRKYRMIRLLVDPPKGTGAAREGGGVA